MSANILVKVSGDLIENKDIVGFIDRISGDNHVVVIVGGGKQVNEEYGKRGLKVDFSEPYGRAVKTFDERVLCRGVLERLRDDYQNKVKRAFVVAPILDVAGVLCPINADNYVKALYLGFEKVYVFSMSSKNGVFKDYPKVVVNPEASK